MTDNSAPQKYDPRAVRRGRLIALMLFAIAVLPVALASAMYFGGWGATGGIANKGELLQPVAAVENFGLVDPQGEPLEQRFYPHTEEPGWLVLMLAAECQESCQTAIRSIRQVHIALGRESDRVQRAIWAPDLSARALEGHSELLRLQLGGDRTLPEPLPGEVSLGQSYQIYVVDPNGNVVLRYDDSHAGEDLLDDLKKLLRLSNIG